MAGWGGRRCAQQHFIAQRVAADCSRPARPQHTTAAKHNSQTSSLLTPSSLPLLSCLLLSCLTGKYDEGGLEALDYVIASASKHGIKLILSFIDNWKYYNGVDQFVDWCIPARAMPPPKESGGDTDTDVSCRCSAPPLALCVSCCSRLTWCCLLLEGELLADTTAQTGPACLLLLSVSTPTTADD
jgi:hypothetical protein